jgi:hypothetical protein
MDDDSIQSVPPAPARPSAAGRVAAAGLLIATLGASWLAMMAVHELGHVLHAAVSGGCVVHVVLHPLAFSRTDLSSNPRPLFVAWGGVIWGSLVPLAPCAFRGLRGARLGFLLRFFAGFCLIANGAYAAAGVVEPVGDAADMIRLGTPRWVLAMFGVPAMAGGLALWGGTGRQFGIGAGASSVDPLVFRVVIGILVALVAAMSMMSDRG